MSFELEKKNFSMDVKVTESRDENKFKQPKNEIK